MILCDMRNYDFYTFQNENAYGQPQLNKEKQGTINIAIYTVSQALQENIKYKDASYIGLTTDAGVNDTYVIQYGKERLKVLYVQPKGRFKQVFLAGM